MTHRIFRATTSSARLAQRHTVRSISSGPNCAFRLRAAADLAHDGRREQLPLRVRQLLHLPGARGCRGTGRPSSPAATPIGSGSWPVRSLPPRPRSFHGDRGAVCHFRCPLTEAATIKWRAAMTTDSSWQSGHGGLSKSAARRDTVKALRAASAAGSWLLSPKMEPDSGNSPDHGQASDYCRAANWSHATGKHAYTR